MEKAIIFCSCTTFTSGRINLRPLENFYKLLLILVKSAKHDFADVIYIMTQTVKDMTSAPPRYRTSTSFIIELFIDLSLKKESLGMDGGDQKERILKELTVPALLLFDQP